MSVENLTSAIINAICFALVVWQVAYGFRTGRVFTGVGYATRDGMPTAFRVMIIFYLLLALIFGGAALAEVLGVAVQFFPLRIG